MRNPLTPSRIAVLALLAVAGCHRGETGVVKTEPRQVAPFQRIQVDGAIAMTVLVGAAKPQSVSLTGDSGLLPRVHTEVKDGALKLSVDGHVRNVSANIQVPQLDGLSVSGAAKATVSGIAGPKFALNVSGAALVSLTGKTAALAVDVSGAARVKAEGLQAENVTVQQSGAADLHVFASNSLSATVSGAGKVTYAGNPPHVTQKVSGVAAIIKQ